RELLRDAACSVCTPRTESVQVAHAPTPPGGSMQIENQRLLIDGELIPASSGRSYDNVDPATEEVIGTAPDGGAEDIERAVLAARRAFVESDWSTKDARGRECLLATQCQMRKDVASSCWTHTA